MAFDHESWLRKQGVKIVGRHTLRRAVDPGYMDWSSNWADGRIDWSAERYTVREEYVYTVELDQQTIERLGRSESTIKHALDHASRHSSGRNNGYSGYGPNDVSDFMIENKERHLKLLQENPMYKDAWQEFQSIRVLLGETPHWP
jgi:hypothetical protein